MRQKGITVILPPVALFEYDPKKGRINQERHGIDLAEARLLWEVTHVVIPAKNVAGENRSAILARLGGRAYVAIFTRRGEAIRLISCHKADSRWERIYERYLKKGA